MKTAMVTEAYVLPNDKEVTHDPVDAAEQWAAYARTLERLVDRLACGVGAMQSGHEAPWDTQCDDDGGEVEEEEDRVQRWHIEDAAGSYVMEAEDDDLFHESYANARDYTQAICDEVNLAAEVADALAVPLDGVKVTYEGVLKADALIRKAEDETDPEEGSESGEDRRDSDGPVGREA